VRVNDDNKPLTLKALSHPKRESNSRG